MGPSEREGMSRIVTVIPGTKDEGTSKISKQLLKLINVDTVRRFCPGCCSVSDMRFNLAVYTPGALPYLEAIHSWLNKLAF